MPIYNMQIGYTFLGKLVKVFGVNNADTFLKEFPFNWLLLEPLFPEGFAFQFEIYSKLLFIPSRGGMGNQPNIKLRNQMLYAVKDVQLNAIISHQLKSSSTWTSFPFLRSFHILHKSIDFSNITSGAFRNALQKPCWKIYFIQI